MVKSNSKKETGLDVKQNSPTDFTLVEELAEEVPGEALGNSPSPQCSSCPPDKSTCGVSQGYRCPQECLVWVRGEGGQACVDLSCKKTDPEMVC